MNNNFYNVSIAGTYALGIQPNGIFNRRCRGDDYMQLGKPAIADVVLQLFLSLGAVVLTKRFLQGASARGSLMLASASALLDLCDSLCFQRVQQWREKHDGNADNGTILGILGLKAALRFTTWTAALGLYGRTSSILGKMVLYPLAVGLCVAAPVIDVRFIGKRLWRAGNGEH